MAHDDIDRLNVVNGEHVTVRTGGIGSSLRWEILTVLAGYFYYTPGNENDHPVT